MGYEGLASIECNLSGDADDVLPTAVRFLCDRIAATAGAAIAGGR